MTINVLMIKRLLNAVVITAIFAGCTETAHNKANRVKTGGPRHIEKPVDERGPYYYIGGGQLPRNWYLRRPGSSPLLAIGPSGLIYIMDLGCPCGSVRYVSGKGAFLGEFDTNSSGDIAAGPNGFIYALDTIGEISEIRYFGPDGFFRGDWFLLPRKVARARGVEFGAVAVGPSGIVYVAEGKEARVSYYSASGSLLGEWGRTGSGPGEFHGPNDIAVAPTGTVYVSDSRNGRIQYFSPDGKYLGEWGSGYAPDGGFGGLLSIAVTPRGNVLTADIYEKEIEVFTGEGSFIGSFAIPGLEGREYYYRDLAVGTDGTVYVSFADPGYIWAFAPNKGE
jgi:hypothetical protein